MKVIGWSIPVTEGASAGKMRMFIRILPAATSAFYPRPIEHNIISLIMALGHFWPKVDIKHNIKKHKSATMGIGLGPLCPHLTL